MDPTPQKQAFLDDELKAANQDQITELTAYRAESLQLAGFAGIVASITVVLKSAHQWALIAVVVIFGVILIIDALAVGARRTLARSYNPMAAWTRAEKVERMGGGFKLPSLPELRRDAFDLRRAAFETNRRRIRQRRYWIAGIRILLFAAVLISLASTISGGSTTKFGQATQPPPPPTVGTAHRHHHQKWGHRGHRYGWGQPGRARLPRGHHG